MEARFWRRERDDEMGKKTRQHPTVHNPHNDTAADGSPYSGTERRDPVFWDNRRKTKARILGQPIPLPDNHPLHAPSTVAQSDTSSPVSPNLIPLRAPSDIAAPPMFTTRRHGSLVFALSRMDVSSSCNRQIHPKYSLSADLITTLPSYRCPYLITTRSTPRELGEPP